MFIDFGIDSIVKYCPGWNWLFVMYKLQLHAPTSGSSQVSVLGSRISECANISICSQNFNFA